jgi:regulator of sigma E protease
VGAIFLEPGESAPLVVERDGERLDLRIAARYEEESGAVQIGVLPAFRAVLQQGEALLEVGPDEPATVEGVAVRGGWAVANLVEQALGAGVTEVTVAREDGTSLKLRPVRDPAPVARPTYKVGIEQAEGVVVARTRGVAAEMGLLAGDVVEAALLGGERVSIGNRQDLARLAFLDPPAEGLWVRRGAETLTVDLPARGPAAMLRFLDDLGLETQPGVRVQPVPVGAITSLADGLYRYPRSPADEAGLLPGDVLVEFGTVPVKTWAEVLARVASLTGSMGVDVVVQRGETETTLRLTPVALERLAEPRVSMELVREPLHTDGLGDAVAMAVVRTGRDVADFFRMIGSLITGQLNFGKNVGGPVTIVKASMEASEQSWLTLLTLLAYISVTLAGLNILPIPVLDGGHLLFLLLEKVKGSPLKEETMGRIQMVGLALILVLMFFALRNDFRNVIFG